MNQLSSNHAQPICKLYHMFYYEPAGVAKVMFGLFFHRDKNEATLKQQSQNQEAGTG